MIKILLSLTTLIISFSLTIIASVNLIKNIWKFLNILEIKLINKTINKNHFSLTKHNILFIISFCNIVLKIGISYITIINTIKILIFLIPLPIMFLG